ncbi:MAG: tetratricopeptide repeat protein [Gammaproteobacteria bacterium]|jgi:tetratricopeptide (TPR) repeat protein|nr:tetratricopeptide repeat protein [Gammaproteobacteria bacterium]
MRYSLLILLPFLFLSACAGLQPQPDQAMPAERPTVAEPAAAPQEEPAETEPALAIEPPTELPPVSLDGDLLYQILTAEMALQRHHYEVGLGAFLRLAAATRDPRFAERATKTALFIHDDAAALDGARLWVELVPETLEPRQMLVVAAIRTGHLEEALDQMARLTAQGEALPEERFELIAGLLSREHDVREALRLMERFVASRRDDPSALYAYAHLAVRAGELEKARQAIDEALELRPGWREAIMLRIRTLLMADGPDAAMAYLSEAVRSNPSDTALRHAYARTLAETQNYDEALAQYQILAGQLEPNAEILMAMGMIHLQLGHIDEAEALLRRVQDAGGHEADLQFYLGWIAEERGDIDQAIAYYAALGPDSPNQFEGRLRIAVLTADGGDIGGARRQLQTLRADEPGQQRRLYQVESELLLNAGLREEAMAVLSVALDHFGGDFDLLYSRALLAERMNRLDLAESDLLQILAREPDHVDALNALGYTLADRTDRYREAYGYIQRALELHPDNNAILDSMGWVLYRLGNFEESIRYLRRSLAIKQDHEVAAHLGEVLWMSGEREEAVSVWRRALEAFPDDEMLRATMQRFVR